MRPTPVQAIVCGLAFIVFGTYFFISVLVLNPPGKLSSEKLTFIEGKMLAKGDAGIRRGYGTLEIWVSDQAIPFRCFDGPYPGSFDAQTLGRLTPGVPVRVGVVSTELASPRTNRAQGQQFYPFVSLDVEGRPALTLASYNSWEVSNVRTGCWFMASLICFGVYLVWAGFAARRHGRSTMLIHCREKKSE